MWDLAFRGNNLSISFRSVHLYCFIQNRRNARRRNLLTIKKRRQGYFQRCDFNGFPGSWKKIPNVFERTLSDKKSAAAPRDLLSIHEYTIDAFFCLMSILPDAANSIEQRCLGQNVWILIKPLGETKVRIESHAAD